jgi:NitT/TauT family transport system ATP-binding protein
VSPRMPGVSLEGVSKSFPGTTALEDIDLGMESGSFTAVVGASGSGKSTLLRLLGGLDEPSTGSIEIGGMTPGENRRAKRVGWMAQQPALLPWKTVEENVALAQSINPHPDRKIPGPRDLIEMVGLVGQLDSYPYTLSGGMQQRVALARTLAVGAPLWLMDEPFAALDEMNRSRLADDLLEIWRAIKPTVVWVTHHLSEAVKLADQVVLLTSGPGRIAGIIDVDLPRPREETSAEFQAIVRRARDTLWATMPARRPA